MKNFDVAMTELLERIKDDYAGWRSEGPMTPTRQKMVKKFNETLRVEEGRKYIKIITDTSVWGFIVKEDIYDKRGGGVRKFLAGDILKAASWSSPATNAARGNIFEDYTIRWTGPNYLI